LSVPDFCSGWNLVFSNVSANQERQAAGSVAQRAFKELHTRNLSPDSSTVGGTEFKRDAHPDQELPLGLFRDENEAAALDREGRFYLCEEFHYFSTKP